MRDDHRPAKGLRYPIFDAVIMFLEFLHNLGRKINLAVPPRKASVRESIGSTKIACAIATMSVSENMDQAGSAKAAVQRSREENWEASVARMKCNEIRGTEPPSISPCAIEATVPILHGHTTIPPVRNEPLAMPAWKLRK